MSMDRTITEREPASAILPRPKQRGFSLLEVLIASLVLTMGLVGILSVFAVALAGTQSSQQDMIVKQLASEAMESIFTARNTSQIQWLQIQNVGAGTVPDGIFVTGFQPIHQSGADGILGTADDAAAPALTLTMPGPDGIVGTADDVQLSLAGYTRSIAIGTVAGTSALRTVTITIQYTVPPLMKQRSYVMTGYISQYR